MFDQPRYDWRFWVPFLFAIGALTASAAAAVALHLQSAGA